MTTGSMRTVAANISDADKRLIAEWVAGRKLDTDLIGAAEKMPNMCASHPQVRESNAPAWNGWGVDHRNSRFQRGAAAGLSPGQVSRLQLKWAFGFPGATALYGQTVYDGRLYVTSNAGYVYSLDAETGCLHWGFRAQSAVRSGFTIGRLSKTDRAAGDLLRRHPRHGIRAVRHAPAKRFGKRSPIRIPSRASPARRCCSKDGCTCRSRRSKSRSRDRRITRAARSAAICRRSTRPRVARSGRRTRFQKRRRSSARTRVEKTCSSRPAPASGRHRRSTRSAAGCTSRPAMRSQVRRIRRTP